MEEPMILMEEPMKLIEPYDFSDVKHLSKNRRDIAMEHSCGNVTAYGKHRHSGISDGGDEAIKHDPRFELDRIKDSLLTYLGSAPAKLARPGVSWDDPGAIGELILNLGKCLKWLSPALDGREHPEIVTQPEEGKATSIYELGEQFRILGLRYLDAKKRERELSSQEVRRRLLDFEAQLERLKKNGGAK